MSIDFHTALAVCALVASVILVLQAGERLIPLIALVACAIEALSAFHVLQLSSPRVRIDMILPAVLVITGGIAWARSSSKPAISASTVLALVGVIQLVHALRVLNGAP
ncbi:MAG TPA: hypothetical protein VHW23_01175 [Kofleriaceae bacterium]|jgi:hypothetical protein|nr:hypothetical protein [Kofleriaceae bacterium]